MRLVVEVIDLDDMDPSDNTNRQRKVKKNQFDIHCSGRLLYGKTVRLNVLVPYSLLLYIFIYIYFTANTVISCVNMHGIVPFVHAQR